MSDIYINATLFETKLREAHDAALDQVDFDAAILYERLIDILKSQPRFQRIDVKDQCVIDNATITCIPENAVMDMAKENLSHDLGEYAVKHEYAKITSYRSPIFNNSLVLELYASFLIPEQQSIVSDMEGDEDATD